MGIKLKDLVAAQPVTLDGLAGKTLAIDAFNMLYQFLTTIRQRDGSLLTDSRGNITSHLNGLFYRCTKFMEHGLRLVFVFDGTPPAIKASERGRRAALKQEARERYDEARRAGDLESMRKFASRTSILTDDMLAESRKLLSALGLPVIQAPSEGEAQAAHLARKGDAFAVVSQDFDSLLFGAPRVVRNLSLEGRRKHANRLQYDIVKPELITLSEVLNSCGIDQDQLIAAALLIGTDYNPGGIPGIGPKNAIRLVKQYRDLDQLFQKVEWSKHSSVSWKEVFDTIRHMPVTDEGTIAWKPPDADRITALLVGEHDFAADRVGQRLKKFKEQHEARRQQGLQQWF